MADDNVGDVGVTEQAVDVPMPPGVESIDGGAITAFEAGVAPFPQEEPAPSDLVVTGGEFGETSAPVDEPPAEPEATEPAKEPKAKTKPAEPEPVVADEEPVEQKPPWDKERQISDQAAATARKALVAAQQRTQQAETQIEELRQQLATAKRGSGDALTLTEPPELELLDEHDEWGAVIEANVQINKDRKTQNAFQKQQHALQTNMLERLDEMRTQHEQRLAVEDDLAITAHYHELIDQHSKGAEEIRNPLIKAVETASDEQGFDQEHPPTQRELTSLIAAEAYRLKFEMATKKPAPKKKTVTPKTGEPDTYTVPKPTGIHHVRGLHSYREEIERETA